MEMSNATTLNEIPLGTTVRVVAVKGRNAITRRLMEMGVVPGVSITTIKKAPFGDPLEIRVRGYSLALRHNEAIAVEVMA
jgi:ferrous iron transport protein A